MRSLKSAGLILLVASLASCVQPQGSGVQSSPPVAAPQAKLVCETIQDDDTHSCNDLCEAKQAVCTGFYSNVNPSSCESPYG